MLVVHALDSPSAQPPAGGAHRVAYWFDSDLTAMRRAYEHTPSGGWWSFGFAVPAKWRELRADFRQQVLNVPFADVLTRIRPREVRVETLHGCSMDLPRLAAALGCRVGVVPPPLGVIGALSERTRQWVAAAIASASYLEPPPGVAPEAYADLFPGYHAAGLTDPSRGHPSGSPRLDYARYEFVLRDHPLLWRMQEGYARFFEGCTDILDVGCGTGVFLGILEAAGLQGQGVDRNPSIVRYAQELGFDVHESDALAWLEQHPRTYGAIYCSHFVEHLDVEGVERLMVLLARALRPGGRVVLVFPDPESIRSQLLGFWRDPEHVRFYHPELIELMGRAVGLDCIWHSHRDGMPHEVVPFPASPSVASAPELPELPEAGVGAAPSATGDEPEAGAGIRTRILRRLGLVPARRVRHLEQRLASLESALDQSLCTLTDLRADTQRLWKVNQTWAWEDNAVLVLQRPEHSGQDV